MKQNLSSIILESKGKFLTVQFTKKDGSIRVLNGRLGVKKYLKGGNSTLDQSKFITIWDRQLKQYRSINKDSILSVSFKHQTFEA